jgi:DNA replication protein DnaC
MSDNTNGLMSHSEWLEERRRLWTESGTTDDYDTWANKQFEKTRREQADKREQEWRQERAEQRLAALNKAIPSRYHHARLDGSEDPRARAWVDGLLAARPQHDEKLRRDGGATLHGSSLMVLGATGRGKTHLACALLRHLVETENEITMPIPTVVSCVDLFATLRPRSGVDTEEVFGRYSRAGILFIDDLGVAKSSEWTEQETYRLVNHRYNNQLPTLITTNVPPKELAAALGERTAGRLTEMCEFAVLKGQDRRRAA